jgi:molybdopterin adenylyltransferase
MPTCVVLTISDSRSRGQAQDESGPTAASFLRGLAIDVRTPEIIPDELENISRRIREYVNQVNLIVTTGGTGVGPRDVTPEAVRPLFDRELPGFGEIMRTATFAKTPLSIISRGGAGIAGKTLIVMLPGSPKGVRECLECIGPAIKHILKVLSVGKLDCAGEIENRP